ncbi:hypothetical protein RJ55_07336 [Drechmeria coniospora]|nr:hypothetical protein RJ55_07336 [Drechmeria coniospora]
MADATAQAAAAKALPTGQPAAEAKAGAFPLPVCAPAPAGHQPGKPERERENHGGIPERALLGPKPVEVQSLPQTPLDGSTPAGGTPRPELKIDEEPPPADSHQVIPGLFEPAPPPAPPGRDDAGSVNGEVVDTLGPGKPSTLADPAIGDKRKLNDASLADDGAEPSPKPAVAPAPAPADPDPDTPTDKKAKMDDGAVDDANDSAPAPNAVPGNGGRPKKDKTAPPPVGRTARKTRSQGPAEA